MADAPDTVTEAVALLRSEGYTDDLSLRGSEVVCTRCESSHVTEAATVERKFRFEGPSDPADEAIVLGVACPECGAKGVLVSAYGPDADPALAEAFAYLSSRAVES